MASRPKDTRRREPGIERARHLDVVALVARELKHPVAAIEVALPLMAEAPEPATRAKARHAIERQLICMRRVVSDLLDAERARRGDLDEQRCARRQTVRCRHDLDASHAERDDRKLLNVEGLSYAVGGIRREWDSNPR